MFNLSDYVGAIANVADTKQMDSREEALDLFLTSLAVMRDHRNLWPDLNLHALGQQWNKLTSAARQQQVKDVRAKLKVYSRLRGMTNGM